MTRGRARRWGLLLAASLALAACGRPPPVNLRPIPRAYRPGDYAGVLDRFTRSEDMLELPSMDNHLTVTATYPRSANRLICALYPDRSPARNPPP